MQEALTLARAQAGRTGENPSVGCIIVRDGAVIARGATADGGRPHAERVALDAAGAGAVGADVYVTLEPCAHAREGGNCRDALIVARPARVVIAVQDPDPRTDGEAIRVMRAAGIAVEVGLLEDEARAVNAEFFARHGA